MTGREALEKSLIDMSKIADNLQARIDKAIEQLQIRNRQNESALTNREETIISKHDLLKREITENNFLIGLLKGSDKE